MFESILRSQVRSIIGIFFVGSFALGASLIILHVAYGHDPVQDAFTAAIIAQQSGN